MYVLNYFDFTNVIDCDVTIYCKCILSRKIEKVHAEHNSHYVEKGCINYVRVSFSSCHIKPRSNN